MTQIAWARSLTSDRYDYETDRTVQNSRATAPSWGVALGHCLLKSKPAFDLNQAGVITSPNGISYTSASSGELKLEVKSEGSEIVIDFPARTLLSWELLLGSVKHEVWIPAGLSVNQLLGGHGFTVGLSAGIEILRQTMVTPKVEMALGWNLERSSLGKLKMGQTGTSENVDNRFDIEKKSLLFSIEKLYYRNRIVSTLGFEILDINSNLVNLRNGESLSGNRQNYRFFGGIGWRISSMETISAEGSLGDAEGYRIRVQQVF